MVAGISKKNFIAGRDGGLPRLKCYEMNRQRGVRMTKPIVS